MESAPYLIQGVTISLHERDVQQITGTRFIKSYSPELISDINHSSL
jgi:hypothetical protein